MKQMSLLLILMFSCFMPTIVLSQTEAEAEAEYQRRIKLDMIDGVYIPSDLEDVFAELQRLADPKAVLEFKSAPEDSIRRKLHFGLGRWMHVNWGLEDGSRISHYFREKGVSLPDDMVELIILSWHRRLNGKPLQTEQEIAAIQQRMDQDKAKRDNKKTTTVIKTSPREKKE